MVWIIESDSHLDAAEDYADAEIVARQFIESGDEEARIYDDESVFVKPVKTFYSWELRPEPDDGP